MDTLTMTDNEIYEHGIKALFDNLGPDGTLRFLRQFDNGAGNYSVDRDQWLTVPDVETLANQIRETRGGDWDDK